MSGGNSTKTTRHQITGDESAYGQVVEVVPAREYFFFFSLFFLFVLRPDFLFFFFLSL